MWTFLKRDKKMPIRLHNREWNDQASSAVALLRLLSTLFNPPPTSLKRDFDSLRKSNQIIRSNSVPQPVVSIQFVDDGDVSEMFEDHREVQIDEYETDSDDEDTENEEHLELVKRACITRFGTELFVHLCVSTCDICIYDACNSIIASGGYWD